jgi:hypothetical protein
MKHLLTVNIENIVLSAHRILFFRHEQNYVFDTSYVHNPYSNIQRSISEESSVQNFNLSKSILSGKCFPSWEFNPNPHCFKTITKATACGWKEPVLPHPLHSTVGWRGRGECFLCSPEDLLIKNVKFAYIIIKSTLKITFLLQTHEW